jgi:hypothetical protein
MATATDRRADLPRAVAGPTSAFWNALSALRGTRIFHPRGAAFDAVLEIPGGAGTGAPLLDEPGVHRAVARLSRGAGLPEPLPDVLGIALRILDAHGPGRHQDLLMNTSVDRPVLHHLMVPAVRGPRGHSYSSVLPYRIGDRLVLFGALPADGPRAFELAVAPVLGRMAPVGVLRLGDRLGQRDTQALRFNPWHTGGGIRPAGPFQKARAAAYRGSQAGRGGR